MTVRRTLPYLLALTLGASAALLAACGGGGTKDGIPAASAGELKSQIEDVKQAVDDGRCSDVRGQLRQVDSGIDDLPGSVEPTLVSALRDGAEKLRSNSVDECDPDAGTQTTETTTTETPRTETTTVPETTTEPSFTETTPTETTPTEPPPPPVTTTPVPPPVTPEPPPGNPPPPISPGGGVTPDIPPDE